VPFYDLVEHAATITAIPLALAGFGATIWQTTRARKAAEAASAAATSAKVQMSRANLLLLIPQLQKAEEELERAVTERSLSASIYWLSAWRWQAGLLRAYLSITAPSDRKVLKLIQSSLTIAGSTKNGLVGNISADLIKDTLAVRDAIVLVTTELGALAATQSSEVGDGANG
jgi:hypothetical protein